MTAVELELDPCETREGQHRVEILALCTIVTSTTVAIAVMVGSTFHTWYSGIAAAVFVIGP